MSSLNVELINYKKYKSIKMTSEYTAQFDYTNTEASAFNDEQFVEDP